MGSEILKQLFSPLGLKRSFLSVSSLLATEANVLPLNLDMNSQLPVHKIEFNLRELADEERIEMYMEEFESEIVPRFEANITKIKSLKPGGLLAEINVLRINYATYRFAQDEFGVGWTTLWYFHDEESTCSFDDAAYVKGPGGQIGPMQRASDFYPDSQVRILQIRYPILLKLPQKRAGDAAEIVWAAWKLDNDAKAALRNDQHKDRVWGMQDAIIGYSARAVGQRRWENIQVIDGIFTD